MQIDFSMPKRLNKVSTPDHAGSVIQDATQPFEDEMQIFIQPTPYLLRY